ncbi:MAG TPA: hypothetical protein VL986_01070 [Terracidiphilus sp.]|nr:hypothetical protein [Terracidiphilus sp.]
MPISKVTVCLALIAPAAVLCAQNPSPTTYTVIQAGGVPGAQITIYRNGSKALLVNFVPAQGGTPASKTYSLYDIAAGKNWSWNPDFKPVQCSAGTFSGDWGDPFFGSAEVLGDIAKGEFKPAGIATMNGFATEIYTGSQDGANYKVWYDRKDNLVVRLEAGMPNTPMTAMTNVTKLSLATPPASLLSLPPSCAGVKAPPTPAEIIADETGDDPANYETAYTGPYSENSCEVTLHIVDAKTMAPISQRVQVAIDTTYKQDNPPHYTMGQHDDGSETFGGGGIHEITNSIHNGVVSLGNVPNYFMLNANVVEPGHGGTLGLVYRKCFASNQVLLWVVKDRGTSTESTDALWVKGGKFAAPPTH